MKRTRILVVDDDLDVLELVRDALSLAGYETEATSDSVSALAMLETGRYDLVLSDIMMPRVSGLHLLSAIKRAWPGTPVILLTGQPTPERATEAARGGAFACITKPFAIEDLLGRVRDALVKQAGALGPSGP